MKAPAVPAAEPSESTSVETAAALEQTRSELAIERNKREKLQALLSDVMRERQAPFIVPQLLMAFTEISNLTSYALQQ
jgi:hypothetical protein